MYRPGRIARMHESPKVWHVVTGIWWKLSHDDADVLWQALCKSTYARPTALRQQLALPGSGFKVDLEHFALQVFSPRESILMLEDLVHEQRLTRASATRIEEVLFARMNAEGKWL
jgi:hypothetical protein